MADEREPCAACWHRHQDGDPCGLPIVYFDGDGYAGQSLCDCPLYVTPKEPAR